MPACDATQAEHTVQRPHIVATPTQHRSQPRSCFQIRPSVLCVSAAGLGRWTANLGTGSDSTVLAQSRFAADAYRVVTAHPGQGALDASASPAELGEWLGDGDSKVRIPKLQLLGYRQIGGQVLPTGAGPAAANNHSLFALNLHAC